MFTDTLEAAETSWHRRSRYAQVFATKFCWIQVFPIQKKSNAHKGLFWLKAWDCIPAAIGMANAREHTMGNFRKKAREMGCDIKHTEPYSHWQNVAEGAIREVKWGAGRNTTSSKAAHKLWDHCLELEASHAILDLFELQGQVPVMILSGQTADIWPFIECRWHEFVRWYDTRAPFPDYRERCGRFLGPSLNIEPAMMAKILKENSQIIHLCNYWSLNETQLSDAGNLHSRQHSIKILHPPYHDDDDNQNESEGAELWARPKKESATRPEESNTYVGAQVNPP